MQMATSVARRYVRFNAVRVLGWAIAAAWAVCIWVDLSGNAAQLHHHELYKSGRPFWLAALIVLAAWQFMTAAMMLPSSLGFIRYYAAIAAHAPDFSLALVLFVGGYFAVWTAFALAAFTGDMEVHRIVDARPWLGAHATLIPAATLSLAALYQFTPLKEACLKACRHPGIYLVRHYRRGVFNGLRLGFGHAIYCLGCCWALMLLMFAAGVAHLAWMGVLAAITFVEKATPAGNRVVVPVGVALAAPAAIAFWAPGAIPGL
jgi:predicted metal-binding membrane protein